jgi:mRNA interferase HigB
LVQAGLIGEMEKTKRGQIAFGANVDFVGDNRVIFDVGGNKYRLIVRIVYDPYYRAMIKFYRAMIKFVGTHAEYDDIDPETV